MTTTPTARPATAAVVTLRAGRPAPAAELGGKGGALDQLAQHGFRIPDTAVVTASAYRAVAADPGVAALLDRIAAGADEPADAVDAVFLAATAPRALTDEITAAARLIGSGSPIAVRSSATVEDMATASFAGQYRSTLDVEGDEAVLRAVRLTWASLWHPAPRAYRRSWGIGRRDPIAMAVVLMRMVPAELAGVAFTTDPGGSAGDVRVEAVPELGEALVSGNRTPDVWLVPRDARRRRPDGAPARVTAAADLALDVERARGRPQDIEWAWDRTGLWLLQARPITVAAGARRDPSDTDPGDDELTTNGIGEMLPGVVAPLPWDLGSTLTEEALRDVLGQLGGLPDGDERRFTHRVHGRAALDLDLLRAVARTLPGGSEADLERQYFGVASAPAGPARRVSPWRAVRHGLRAAAIRRRADVEADIVVTATAALLDRRPALRGMPDSALLSYRRRLLAFGARAMAVEFAVAASATAAYQQLEEFLAPHVGRQAAAATAQRVTAGAGLPPTVSPIASRSVFAGPSWAETGVAPPTAARRHRDLAAAADLERRLVGNPRWRRTRLLTGQLVDVRLHLLRRLIQDTTSGLARREQVKAAVLAVGGLVRLTHLEIARRLVTAGLLDAADDIDLLRDRELDPAPADERGRGGAPAWERLLPPPAELARRRRELAARQEEPPLPVRFRGSPERARPGSTASAAGEVLAGWAASPGRHTGRAVVVTDPVRDPFPAGAVLVATATDAGWSPLFVRAGAIVVERGGPLSHAAIVARELGVPAVLNLDGATAALDGATVTVDGDEGTVLVHRQGGGGA